MVGALKNIYGSSACLGLLLPYALRAGLARQRSPAHLTPFFFAPHHSAAAALRSTATSLVVGSDVVHTFSIQIVT